MDSLPSLLQTFFGPLSHYLNASMKTFKWNEYLIIIMEFNIWPLKYMANIYG
jgi:hypothetical protein